jgi:hypothetical protein
VHAGRVHHVAQRKGHWRRVDQAPGLAGHRQVDAGQPRQLARPRARAVHHDVGAEVAAGLGDHPAHPPARLAERGDAAAGEHARAEGARAGQRRPHQGHGLDPAVLRRVRDQVHRIVDGELRLELARLARGERLDGIAPLAEARHRLAQRALAVGRRLPLEIPHAMEPPAAELARERRVLGDAGHVEVVVRARRLAERVGPGETRPRRAARRLARIHHRHLRAALGEAQRHARAHDPRAHHHHLGAAHDTRAPSAAYAASASATHRRSRRPGVPDWYWFIT